MTFPTEEQHAAAVIAALAAANANPYDLDDLAKLPATPAYYTEVTVSRRYLGEGQRAGGDGGVRLVRITTRAVAQTVSNAREMRRRATVALEGVSLPVAGFETTPIEFEGEDTIAPDDGWYSGLTTRTYAV